MPKLGVFSGEEIVRILESEGFFRARQKGSHLTQISVTYLPSVVNSGFYEA